MIDTMISPRNTLPVLVEGTSADATAMVTTKPVDTLGVNVSDLAGAGVECGAGVTPVTCCLTAPLAGSRFTTAGETTSERSTEL